LSSSPGEIRQVTRPIPAPDPGRDKNIRAERVTLAT
jgi:hypothetical protein